MNLEAYYQNLVKKCKDCKGVGTIPVSDTEIKLCHCMTNYMFVVQMSNLGVPFSKIISYNNIPNADKKKIHFIFKDDDKAFNLFMSLVPNYKLSLYESTNMYSATNFQSIDGVMIYNLGLETFNNNGLTLYRIMKDVKDRDLFGIFAFAIKKEVLKFHYPDFIAAEIESMRTP